MTEKHRIEVENGEEVSAVFHNTDSDNWIIFCHGFGSNKEGSYEKRAHKAAEEGFNAARFDFRGNGESDGNFIEQNLSSRLKDLKTVIEYINPEKYALFGSSFGGKVVFHTALEKDPEAVIGRAPVTYNSIMDDYRDEIEEKGYVEKIPGKKVDNRFFNDFDDYSFDEVEEKINMPVMIFHGDTDQLVDIENTWKAAKNMNTDVTGNKFRDEDHSFSEQAEKVMQERMFSWLKTVL